MHLCLHASAAGAMRCCQVRIQVCDAMRADQGPGRDAEPRACGRRAGSHANQPGPPGQNQQALHTCQVCQTCLQNPLAALGMHASGACRHLQMPWACHQKIPGSSSACLQVLHVCFCSNPLHTAECTESPLLRPNHLPCLSRYTIRDRADSPHKLSEFVERFIQEKVPAKAREQ